MQRVVKLKLHPTPEQKGLLLDTVHQYAACFNEAARVGWQDSITNGVDLHRATYYPIRAVYPKMPSQLVISARMKAVEALKAVFARKKQGRKAGQPKSRFGAIRYDARTYAFWPEKQTVSLSTLAGRQHIPVSVPEYFQLVLTQAASFDSADLVYHRAKHAFWLHLIVSLPDAVPASDGPVVGVDVGMTRLAVTSANLFIDGRHVKDVANRYFRLRRSLQTKGTRSATRKLKAVRHREQRFRTDVNHVVSKRLVSAMPTGTTIVLEDLTHIRDRAKGKGKRQRRQMASWSFADLQAKITYKAQTRGIRVLLVDPAYTSQTCPRCGHVDSENRKTQSLFSCVSCGYQSNADRVAALTLAQRGRSVLSGLSVNQPNASGVEAKAAKAELRQSREASLTASAVR